MKTFAKSLLYAGLLSLLTTAPLLARVPNPDRPITSSGWVSSPDASFNTRTFQAANGDLVVQVNHRSLPNLTIQMQTLLGEEVAWVPVPKQQSVFGARLDISSLTDGDYRIIIATGNDRIVKIVSLKTPMPTIPVRQATIAVANPTADH